jgi:hypothetical protein
MHLRPQHDTHKNLTLSALLLSLFWIDDEKTLALSTWFDNHQKSWTKTLFFPHCSRNPQKSGCSKEWLHSKVIKYKRSENHCWEQGLSKTSALFFLSPTFLSECYFGFKTRRFAIHQTSALEAGEQNYNPGSMKTESNNIQPYLQNLLENRIIPGIKQSSDTFQITSPTGPPPPLLRTPVCNRLTMKSTIVIPPLFNSNFLFDIGETKFKLSKSSH